MQFLSWTGDYGEIQHPSRLWRTSLNWLDSALLPKKSRGLPCVSALRYYGKFEKSSGKELPPLCLLLSLNLQTILLGMRRITATHHSALKRVKAINLYLHNQASICVVFAQLCEYWLEMGCFLPFFPSLSPLNVRTSFCGARESEWLLATPSSCFVRLHSNLWICPRGLASSGFSTWTRVNPEHGKDGDCYSWFCPKSSILIIVECKEDCCNPQAPETFKSQRIREREPKTKDNNPPRDGSESPLRL